MSENIFEKCPICENTQNDVCNFRMIEMKVSGKMVLCCCEQLEMHKIKKD